jgi:hypothetical protein
LQNHDIHGIYRDILCIYKYNSYILGIYQDILGVFMYILVYTIIYQDTLIYTAMMEEGQGDTQPCSDGDSEGGDPNPCREDEEFFSAPDAESQEEAINKFMEGLEGEEHSGFSQIHRLLSSLPVPVQKENRSMTHAEAIEGAYCTMYVT